MTTNVTTSHIDNRDNSNNRAKALSIVIAGCYLGSAWAYFSASVLFLEQSQMQLLHLMNVDTADNISLWPWVFYLNGILSSVCLFLFQDEFNFILPLLFLDNKKSGDTNDNDDINLWKETQLIVKSTLLSKSRREGILAQIGGGALLYSIASWDPLYLEIIAASTPVNTTSIVSNLLDKIFLLHLLLCYHLLYIWRFCCQPLPPSLPHHLLYIRSPIVVAFSHI